MYYQACTKFKWFKQCKYDWKPVSIVSLEEAIPAQAINFYLCAMCDIKKHHFIWCSTHIFRKQSSQARFISFYDRAMPIQESHAAATWNTKKSRVLRRNPIAPMHYLSSDSSLIVGGKSIARRPLVPMYLFNQVWADCRERWKKECTNALKIACLELLVDSDVVVLAQSVRVTSTRRKIV
jgi:hypothetical protein